MRWVAIFDDAPGNEWIRRQHAEEHFAYLASHPDKILIGGGLRDPPGAGFCGGLWVLEVETRQDAGVLCEQDPYVVRGLRAGYRVCTWGTAPLYGSVAL